MKYIVNGTVYTPTAIIPDGVVTIEGGIIQSVASLEELEVPRDAEKIDAAGGKIVPGFIDIHVHGGAGHDTMDANPKAIHGMAQFFASHGVTGFLPTTITATKEAILAAIENAAFCQEEGTGSAQVLGVHIEGPYISPRRPGAQPVQYIRPANPDEYREFFAWDNIRLISLASEIPENRELITFAVQHGTTVAVGHSEASYEEVLGAVRLGLSHSIHTFNAMGGLHHRRPGTVGAVLTCDTITAEVIADGIHIHPAVVKLLMRAKGIERMVLMTDGIRATGMPEGTYDVGGQQVTVKGGRAKLATGVLAGSILTMDRAVANVQDFTGCALADALKMATLNPAKVLGLADRKGRIATGCDADVVVLDEEDRPRLTMVGGEVIWQV